MSQLVSEASRAGPERWQDGAAIIAGAGRASEPAEAALRGRRDRGAWSLSMLRQRGLAASPGKAPAS
jgi:hypothetical protein